jgi:hypothetical protein
MDGLAFAPDGTLYGISQSDGDLYTINPTTGATTLVGISDLSGFDLGGLTFDSQGNLFAVVSNGGGASFLYGMNRTTGAGTFIGNVGFNSVSGLTALRSAPAVPEPLSVAVFGGLMAVGGLVARRRKA